MQAGHQPGDLHYRDDWWQPRLCRHHGAALQMGFGALFIPLENERWLLKPLELSMLRQVAVFEGACYTTPLIGAVFADSMWGRYKTILVFSMIYLVVGWKQQELARS